MTGTPIRAGGMVGIVCVRARGRAQGKQRRACEFCSRAALYQCDGERPKKTSKSCDRYLCEKCTRQRPDELGDTIDICPSCIRLEQRTLKKARDAAERAKQGDLFGTGKP